MPHRYSLEARVARFDRALKGGFLQSRQEDHRHVLVPRRIAARVKTISDSLSLHDTHNTIDGQASHYARNATNSVRHVIGDATASKSQDVHRRANRAKHEWARTPCPPQPGVVHAARRLEIAEVEQITYRLASMESSIDFLNEQFEQMLAGLVLLADGKESEIMDFAVQASNSGMAALGAALVKNSPESDNNIEELVSAKDMNVEEQRSADIVRSEIQVDNGFEDGSDGVGFENIAKNTDFVEQVVGNNNGFKEAGENFGVVEIEVSKDIGVVEVVGNYNGCKEFEKVANNFGSEDGEVASNNGVGVEDIAQNIDFVEQVVGNDNGFKEAGKNCDVDEIEVSNGIGVNEVVGSYGGLKEFERVANNNYFEEVVAGAEVSGISLGVEARTKTYRCAVDDAQPLSCVGNGIGVKEAVGSYGGFKEFENVANNNYFEEVVAGAEVSGISLGVEARTKTYRCAVDDAQPLSCVGNGIGVKEAVGSYGGFKEFENVANNNYFEEVVAGAEVSGISLGVEARTTNSGCAVADAQPLSCVEISPIAMLGVPSSCCSLQLGLIDELVQLGLIDELGDNVLDKIFARFRNTYYGLLASEIRAACSCPEDVPSCTRKKIVAAYRRELEEMLRDMQLPEDCMSYCVDHGCS
eukprot:CAMPEP_0115630744 /NCGR_PEP_ID=MMETSP0272-20121206/30637_1 /TAXON_ID=71861 /ORGANISM="Scrippsiella trochoidea, Strain CCMP3099" /LENGTH=639 /DNA_ID=CAMNT_0003067379 /DNA_START=92 /DNA_END=2008 /DNA_ORIENTATION=+